MKVTFDKTSKQRIFQWIRKTLADADDPHCPFCGVKITAKNFAGAGPIQGELRAFNGGITCLIQLAKEIPKDV